MSSVPLPIRGLLLALPLLALCTVCALLLSRLMEACGALGLWPVAALCGLLLWGLLGEQLPGSGTNLRYAGTLLVAGAGLRVMERTLHAPRLGRAALRVECYAAAILAGHRQRRWSPRAYTLICALSVQADTLMQGSLDYGLRH
jgi:hypothetical protein